MNNNIETIKNLLCTKYQTHFSVSISEHNLQYQITPNNRQELAGILGCEVDSDSFLYDLDRIEQAVNLIF